jgi:hypothetical protein
VTARKAADERLAEEGGKEEEAEAAAAQDPSALFIQISRLAMLRVFPHRNTEAALRIRACSSPASERAYVLRGGIEAKVADHHPYVCMACTEHFKQNCGNMMQTLCVTFPWLQKTSKLPSICIFLGHP